MDVRKLHKTHEQLEHGHDGLTGGVDSLSNIIEYQHSKPIIGYRSQKRHMTLTAARKNAFASCLP